MKYRLRTQIRSSRGATLIEYALLCAMAVLVIAPLSEIGIQTEVVSQELAVIVGGGTEGTAGTIHHPGPGSDGDYDCEKNSVVCLLSGSMLGGSVLGGGSQDTIASVAGNGGLRDESSTTAHLGSDVIGSMSTYGSLK